MALGAMGVGGACTVLPLGTTMASWVVSGVAVRAAKTAEWPRVGTVVAGTMRASISSSCGRNEKRMIGSFGVTVVEFLRAAYSAPLARDVRQGFLDFLRMP